MSIASCLWIEIREMVSFELGKEIEKHGFFRLFTRVGQNYSLVGHNSHLD